MESSKDYWEEYYRKHRESKSCSLFAQFVTPFLETGKRLTEFGCGNAKDSSHFGNIGVNVLAIDQCQEEIGYLSEKFADAKNLNFQAGDMTKLPTLEASDYLYSRFTIHAIDKQGENNLFAWSFENLKPKGLFFIEVRSVNDELFGQGKALPDNAFFSDHYRRFIKLEEISNRLQDAGFHILYKVESRGLAPHRTEDPSVIRIIAQKIK